MATFVTPMSFSRDAEYLAYSGPDGVLKLWETSSGVLKQQYTPSSHLSATCSCLSWSSKRRCSDAPRKKKKRKSAEASAIALGIEELELIALGATSGDVLLYSVTHGDLHSQMTGGHTEEVTGLCWNDDAGLLYSCSTDKHIVEWNVGSNQVQQKWKADKGRLYSICLCSQNRLLSAGRSIKLWDLHKKEILKTFTGHATEVFRLLPITRHCSLETTESIENTYFLSAAVNDRFLNVWQIDTSSKEKSALATFSLSDEPVLLDCTQLDDDSVLLTVTTKRGQLLVFQHALNGKLRKPIKPRLTVQAATSSDKDGTPRPIPILAACIRRTSEKKLLIVHGSFLKPVFEYISRSTKETDLCLIREDTVNQAANADLNVTKIKTPSISKNVTILSPGVMAPEAPSQDTSKRKKRTSSVGEMAMSDRLHAISIETNNESKTLSEPPKADTLAILLTQGLQSRDKKILNNVLLHTDDAVILNTVRRLPVHVVIPFVRELSSRIQDHPQGGRHLVKWIKSVIMHHTSYLMTFPDIIEVFSTLYQKMDTRVATFHKLSKIKGKLDLILSQISSQGEDEAETVANQQPLLMYHEESSDEDFGVDDIMQSHSESEDNWEDLSDMDTREQNGDDGDD